MLNFIYAAFSPGTTGASQVVQLVDVSAFSASIAAGLVTASASAWFNRVAGDLGTTDTQFGLAIYACSGSPSAFPTVFSNATSLGSYMGTILTDDDVDTWQPLGVGLLLPSGTDYLAVELRAIEDKENDFLDPEFDGHYADSVLLNVNVVPVPAAVWLLGSGLLSLVAFRRRKRL